MHQPKTFICLLQRPRFLHGVKCIMEENITFFLVKLLHVMKKF